MILILKIYSTTKHSHIQGKHKQNPFQLKQQKRKKGKQEPKII